MSVIQRPAQPQQRIRSPIHGPTSTIATDARPPPQELDAAHRLNSVSERDLDVFLQARAKKAAKREARGLFGGLVAALSKPKPSTTAAAVKRQLAHTIDKLAKIYADGFVTEHEVDALLGARDRLNAVRGLADADVLLMVPKDVRARLEQMLFEPLALVEDAARRRSTRVCDQIVARDKDALLERLNAPIEHRSLDVDVLVRSGIGVSSLARYTPGDLVCVPRSDGTFSRGVVTANFGTRLDVEMLHDDGTLMRKQLGQEDVERANPLKVGDRFEVDGKVVWATSSNANGMYGFVDEDGGRRRVGADELRALVDGAVRRRAGQTHVGSALMAVPGFLATSPDAQRALEGLLSLRGDPVFGRAAEALRAVVKDPRFRAMPSDQQAMQLEAILKNRHNLPEVLPNFGSERANHASVHVGSTTWGDASLFHVGAGDARPRAVKTSVTLTVAQTSKTFDVVMPESMPHAERSRVFQELTSTLRTLPPETVASLSSIVINPVRNPSDVFFAQQFGTPGFMSAMTAHADTRQITVYPCVTIREALQSFCHEAGHLVSIDVFGSIDGTTPRWDAWRQAVGTDPMRASQYAYGNEREDFAETFSLYMSTKGTARHDAIRAMMPHRFALLDEIAREAAR